MFWAIDNFLMRKNRKLLSLSSGDSTIPVHYNKKQIYGASDDEVVMHLMANESQDTLIDERDGSDTEHLYRRSGSESGFKWAENS